VLNDKKYYFCGGILTGNCQCILNRHVAVVVTTLDGVAAFCQLACSKNILLSERLIVLKEPNLAWNILELQMIGGGNTMFLKEYSRHLVRVPPRISF
jgi:hypothetical protein